MSDPDRQALAEYIQQRLEDCWELDIQQAPDVIPVVYVELDETGRVLTTPRLENPMDDELFLKVASSGVRALQKCPNLNIPSRFRYGYQDWKHLRVRLIPTNLLHGGARK